MNKVFIDTNVLVDWLTPRHPFAEHSTKIVELVERRLITGVVNPLVLANTYYVTATYLDKKTTHRLRADVTGAPVSPANETFRGIRNLPIMGAVG